METIIDEVAAKGCKHVCITGGEPLLQENVHVLMSRLCDKGYILSLETGGSLPTDKVDPRVRTILDIKCPGSKMDHKNHFENLKTLKEHDEIKFVILDRQDYDYAKQVCVDHRLLGKQVLFSPVYGKLNPQELIQWILKDQLPVRLNMQIHKFIWSPETKGV